MRDDDHCLPLAQVPDRRIDLELVFRIGGARRLVEDKDGRVLQDGARDSDTLALPSRHPVAKASHLGVVAFRQRHDEIVDAGKPRGPAHVLDRGVEAHPDVLQDAAAREERLLEDDGDMRQKVVVIDRPHILPTDEHFAGIGIVEAADELDQGRLPRTGRPDDRKSLSLGDAQRYPAHHLARGVVGEPHVAKLDVGSFGKRRSASEHRHVQQLLDARRAACDLGEFGSHLLQQANLHEVEGSDEREQQVGAPRDGGRREHEPAEGNHYEQPAFDYDQVRRIGWRGLAGYLAPYVVLSVDAVPEALEGGGPHVERLDDPHP